MYNHILVSVDRSSDSQKAVAAAAELGAKFGSDVLVVHAPDIPRAVVTGHGAVPASDTGMETEAEAQQMVDEAVAELERAGVRVTGQALTGGHAIASEILAAAERHQADLIVLGSRGMSYISEFMLGSVAHKVIHLAKCPVLLAR